MQQTSLKIIKKLRQVGFQAYWAGGCVRDYLLGLNPKDFDIATSAKPEEIEKLLAKTLAVGKQFGVIIAVEGKNQFEIATFRGEKGYSDRRRPDQVFWSNAEKDAQRRDFTINGMFYDPIKKKVLDYVGGQEDLKKKIIRFIGNPDDRIKEDQLRLLRAVRFKNTFGFKYDQRAYQALKNNAYLIESVSKERIKDELDKMLADKSRAQNVLDLQETGLLQYILAEVNRLKGVPQPDQFHKEGDVFIHTCWALKSLPAQSPLTLVWAVLLHDSGKPDTISFPQAKTDRIRFNKHVKYSAGIASRVGRRLKFPNTERELIVWLVKNHMMMADIPKMKLAKQRRWLRDPRFPWLLKLHKADALGASPRDLSLYKKNLALYEKAKQLLEEEKKRPKIKPLLSGHDLIREFKLDSGPQIGRLLKLIEDAQLEGQIKNKGEALVLVKRNLS